ncbi:MAG: hypothetical protein WAW92_01490, partial [Minisyncoccia bacterium]
GMVENAANLIVKLRFLVGELLALPTGGLTAAEKNTRDEFQSFIDRYKDELARYEKHAEPYTEDRFGM